ncbi:cutinase family protein [Rathayibacter tritici]|uniref:cutinase family protein n=1 Tax=Rathayibacter tritici TaxID=33888 RepID=UPI000829DE7B|nr:cutinase family protein [Rathayibacter tritici]
MAALIVTLSAAALATPAVAAEESNRCDSATVIAVRGSGEPAGNGSAHGDRTYASGGLGGLLQKLASGLQGDPHVPVTAEGLKYPATIVNPDNFGPYFESVNTGAKNLVLEVQDRARSCPNSPIVLAGYSQGAEVIRAAITGTDYEGRHYGLTADDKKHLRSVVLFGAPSYHGGEPWNAPDSGPKNGMTGWDGNPYESLTVAASSPSSHSKNDKSSIVRSYCLTDDYFCQSNYTDKGMDIHNSYANSVMVGESRSFVMSLLSRKA